MLRFSTAIHHWNTARGGAANFRKPEDMRTDGAGRHPAARTHIARTHNDRDVPDGNPRTH
jgi:hypothetical protein